MSNADQVVFQGSGDAGVVTDLWSSSYGMPATDATLDYQPATGSLADGVYTFAVSRALDTGDADQDQVIVCGKDYDMGWTGHKTSSSLGKHNVKGKFSLSLAEDCSITINKESSAADSSVATKFNALVAMATFLFVLS